MERKTKTSLAGTAEDRRFLEEYDGSLYEKPSVTVDLLIFTIRDNRLLLYLIRRSAPPFRGKLALPGVFVRMEENLEEAARRGLKEKAGLEDIYLEQLYTWGEVDRDPRMRIISVSYMALVPFEKLVLLNGDEEQLSENLYDVQDVLAGRLELAFDHERIVECGRERIKNKVEYTDIAYEFMPDQFTLPQLQQIYELLIGKKLYKANFRKKVADSVEETGAVLQNGAHRPSKLYRRAETTIE